MSLTHFLRLIAKATGLWCAALCLMCCGDGDAPIEIGRPQSSNPADSDGDAGDTDGDTEGDTGDTELEPVIALLIDDFEDGDHQSPGGGIWFTYDDSDNHGASS